MVRVAQAAPILHHSQKEWGPKATMAHQSAKAQVAQILNENGLERRRGTSLPSVLTIAALIVLSVGGYLYWRQGSPKPAAAVSSVAKPVVPVTVAVAGRQDVPIYLQGLGTVQASETVAIRSQVDGKLASINFREGQDVHPGDILAVVDPAIYQAQLDQTSAKKSQDEAQLSNAKADLDRYVRLVQTNAGTRQQVDTQTALVAQLTAQVRADEANIENARTYLGYTKIVSPIDGRTGIRLVDSGNIIHANDTAPIVIVTRIKPINVVFSLPQKNLVAVREAMNRGKVSVFADDQDGGRVLGEGTLGLIDNQIDQTTSSMKLKASFDNRSEALWPGEFVSVRLLSETRKNALAIPSAAVQRGPQGLFAWVVREDNTVEARPIDIDVLQTDVAIIKGGMADGDRVVVDGQYRLQEGAHVDAKPVATTAPGQPS
jgi:multidrug efflux system membrane fusion protein